MEHSELFRTEKISKVLLRLAPPVMLAQLIQALYNIVDSLFVGRYSESGLTALSIIYPIQLLMIARRRNGRRDQYGDGGKARRGRGEKGG